MEEEKEETEEIIEIDRFKWKIPDCCLEGWESCPHVVKKQKPIRRNIAL